MTPSRDDATAMTALTDEALLRLEGPDALQFLQGQTTADFVSANPGTLLRGAFCDPKGRVLADFLAAVVTPEAVWLRSRRAVAEALLTHLQRYLMFSKASLEIADWSVSADLNSTGAQPQLDPGQSLMVVPRGDALTEYWSAPTQDARGTLTAEAFRAQEIALMEARIEQETIGSYLPQDLNYDLNEAVSFNKGCYTGQEIIARLHFRGTPKRRLHSATTAGNSPVTPGTPVTAVETGKTLGSVVNGAAVDDHCVMLIEAVADTFEQQPQIADGRLLSPRSAP